MLVISNFARRAATISSTSIVHMLPRPAVSAAADPLTPLAPITGTHTPARIPLATASTEAGAILVRGASARRSLHALRLCDGEEDGADAKLQKLLDTPLIDPTQDNADDPEFLRRFKQLVNDDYNFAEALYAGGVFAVLSSSRSKASPCTSTASPCRTRRARGLRDPSMPSLTFPPESLSR